ncbi:MAG: DUF4349 domain-containing protein [Lysobacteraceae bacterium]|nr:MAG: DUF4349 domain-containing protein [Xanthomonadaceae bacterium]
MAAILRRWVPACAVLFALGACGGKEMAAGAPAKNLSPPLQSPQGAFLAYEHEVSIELAAVDIPTRMQAVQASCQSGKFGDCVVLDIRQSAGDSPSGSLSLRIAPQGIEPIIGQAAQGGQVGSRSAHAEDLAQVVADNGLQQLRLQKEHARLLELQQRRDLAVADLLAISKTLSEIEAGLETAQREGAQHRRRIDTQLVTLEFRPPGGQQGRSEIGRAFSDFGSILAVSIAWMIRTAAALLPLLALLWAGVFLWRRRRRGKR